MFTCRYCAKNCTSKLSKSCHERFCKLNPNYQINLQHHKETSVKAGALAGGITKKEQAKNDPLNQYNNYKIVCSKCGKEFELTLKIRDYQNGHYRKTCSSKCSHSRKLSEASKIRKSEKLKKVRKHICPKCKNEFMHKGTSTNIFCPNCKNIKSIYKHDNLKTELHSIKCKKCQKEIYVKAKNAEYCYECSDLLNIERFQLYDKNGKKVISEKTRKKLSDNAKKLMVEGKIKPWNNRSIKSYSEKFFIKVLNNNNIEFESEKPELGYFLDFVIKTPKIIIDLEIDGKQHWCDKDRIKHDQIRDKKLKEIGYSIYRIKWNEIKTEIGKLKMKEKIDNFLNYYVSFL